MRQFLYIFFFAFAFLLLSCKGSKKATHVKLKERSTTSLLKKLNQHKVDAQWWSAKAKVAFRDTHQNRQFTANIRMRKDSVIWMNFKKTTVEGGRILITPDSFFVINRLDKEYFAADLGYLIRRFDLPTHLSAPEELFSILQDIVLGNPIFSPVDKMYSEVIDDQYYLHGQHNQLKSAYWLNSLYLIEKIAFSEHRGRRKVVFGYENYAEAGDIENYSYFRTLFFHSADIGDVELGLKLSKIEINIPKKIVFKIPGHYTRIE